MGELGGGEVCTAVLTDKTIHIYSRRMIKSVNQTHEPINPINQIKKLAEILEEGIINHSEFDKKKNLLIDCI